MAKKKRKRDAKARTRCEEMFFAPTCIEAVDGPQDEAFLGKVLLDLWLEKYDTTPWLVYADWLAENNQDVRAEFIRKHLPGVMKAAEQFIEHGFVKDDAVHNCGSSMHMIIVEGYFDEEAEWTDDGYDGVSVAVIDTSGANRTLVSQCRASTEALDLVLSASMVCQAAEFYAVTGKEF